MHIRRPILSLLSIFLLTTLWTSQVLAAPSGALAAVSIVDDGSEAVFSEKIVFRAAVRPALEVKEVLVTFQPEGQARQVEKMSWVASGKAALEIPVNQMGISVDIEPLFLAPFSTISYSFEARLKDGSTETSPEYQLVYEDTRFTWQTLKDGNFEVHWNDGDPTLGQEIANLAQTGLENAQSFLAVDPPVPVQIYAYSSSADLQQALLPSGKTWAAGHALPDTGRILISVPEGPEKKLELQRQIPHEIMHLLQYQVTGDDFSRQPVWLLEGMASISELFPDPEYGRLLEDTTRSNNFIAMETLCQSFPDEAAPAYRAYAQSESFVRFLHSLYGTTGLRRLMDEYQNGLSCTEAISAVFGVSLGQLEYRWKQEVLGLDAGGLALKRLSPYLLIGLVLLLPAVLSFIPRRRAKQVNPDQNGGTATTLSEVKPNE